MNCNHCGAEIPAGSAFCLSCGTPVSSQKAQKVKKKQKDLTKKRGNFWQGLIAGVLIVALLCGVLLLTGAASFGRNSYEGRGFASGEEALLTFVDAMKSLDTEKMISCFAIESFVSHLSFENYITGYSYYPEAFPVYLPENMPTLAKFNVYARLQDVAAECSLPFICAANGFFEDGMYEPEHTYARFSIKSDYSDSWTASQEDYPASLNDPQLRQMFASMQVTGPVFDVTAACERELAAEDPDRAENYRAQQQRHAAVLQADDIRDFAVPVTIDGYACYFSVREVCYGGKWYIYSIGASRADHQNYAAGFSLGITGVGGDD